MLQVHAMFTCSMLTFLCAQSLIVCCAYLQAGTLSSGTAAPGPVTPPRPVGGAPAVVSSGVAETGSVAAAKPAPAQAYLVEQANTPTKASKPVGRVDEEDPCVICHEDMNSCEGVTRLECGHKYHTEVSPLLLQYSYRTPLKLQRFMLRYPGRRKVLEGSVY